MYPHGWMDGWMGGWMEGGEEKINKMCFTTHILKLSEGCWKIMSRIKFLD